MTPNVEQESVIRKIKHLLALSKSPNEFEAALAATRVQELLASYNLNMAVVDAANIGKKQEIPGGKRGKVKHNGAAMYQYQKDLMAAIAQCNFCMHYINEEWKQDPRGSKVRWLHSNVGITDANRDDMGRIVKLHVLIGAEVNVITTQNVYDYLVSTMDRLLPWQGMEKRGKNALLWLAGCTERLVERLNERKYEMERESREAAAKPGAETGIVLSSVYASEEDYNEDIRWGLELGTTAKQRRDREARYAADRTKEAELIANGCPKEDAYYIARGLNPPAKIAELPEVKETEAQRIKREAKEERENERWREQAWRRRQKQAQKTLHPAYQAGVSKGSEIGLHDQVRSDTKEKIA